MPIKGRTHEERDHQRGVMERALLSGRKPADIVRAAIDAFGISHETAYSDLRAIREAWTNGTAARKAAAEERFGLALQRREMLFAEAMEQNELALALRIERDACELLGLYPEQGTPQEPTNPGRAVPDLTDAELIAIAGEGWSRDHNQPPADLPKPPPSGPSRRPFE